LAPDSAVIVSVPFAEGARHARAEISVQPDAFYREVFEMLLAGMLSDTSSTLLSEARRRAESSPYILFDEIIPLTR